MTVAGELGELPADHEHVWLGGGVIVSPGVAIGRKSHSVSILVAHINCPSPIEPSRFRIRLPFISFRVQRSMKIVWVNRRQLRLRKPFAECPICLEIRVQRPVTNRELSWACTFVRRRTRALGGCAYNCNLCGVVYWARTGHRFGWLLWGTWLPLDSEPNLIDHGEVQDSLGI